MRLPAWITDWLEAYGVNIKAFAEFATNIAHKLQVPEEWIADAQVWLETNTNLTPEKISAFATLALSEFLSPAPGYDPEHGRDA